MNEKNAKWKYLFVRYSVPNRFGKCTCRPDRVEILVIGVTGTGGSIVTFSSTGTKAGLSLSMETRLDLPFIDMTNVFSFLSSWGVAMEEVETSWSELKSVQVCFSGAFARHRGCSQEFVRYVVHRSLVGCTLKCIVVFRVVDDQTVDE